MISMDINTVLIMLVVFVLIYIALFAGYQMGKKHGAMESLLGGRPVLSRPQQPKKDELAHERDPWDELRIDIPDKAPVIQTLEEEKINE
ncbi:MAG: hypothetical protein WC419_06290 [Candidatus Omnitrophota bacterium]